MMASDAKVTVADLFPEDPDSARKCLACGHEKPHNRGEYEDTHSRCNETQRHFERCERHPKRYSKRCEEQGGNDRCFTYIAQTCDCSSEDRVIAEMNVYIRRASAVLGPECACGHFLKAEHGHSYNPERNATRTYCRVKDCGCELWPIPAAGGTEP